MRRHVLLIVLGMLVLGASAAFADVLVETDREKLEAFADAFDGRVETGQIDNALRYVDTEVQPITARVGRQELRFEDGDQSYLTEMVRDELAPLMGRNVEKVQQNLDVEASSARLALRLRVANGIVDAVFDFRKHSDRWLVSNARVR